MTQARQDPAFNDLHTDLGLRFLLSHQLQLVQPIKRSKSLPSPIRFTRFVVESLSSPHGGRTGVRTGWCISMRRVGCALCQHRGPVPRIRMILCASPTVDRGSAPMIFWRSPCWCTRGLDRRNPGAKCKMIFAANVSLNLPLHCLENRRASYVLPLNCVIYPPGIKLPHFHAPRI